MNNKAFFLIAAAGLVVISYYTLVGTSNKTDGYIEEIEATRIEKNKELKNSDESPLTDDQKEIFSELSYFPIVEKYKLRADLNKNDREQVVKISITDGTQREYLVFGNAHFHLDGKELNLTIYKPVTSGEDYLFIPFYDKTSADQTYGGGRYVEPELIDGGTIEIDFNTAYNPYCAYNHVYRCPIPPQNNKLIVSIRAGEKIPDFMH